MEVAGESLLPCFQQAIAAPRLGIERLWRDYNSFEQVWTLHKGHVTTSPSPSLSLQSVNKVVAKKLIEFQSRFYVNAKRATHEYDGVTRGLIRGAVSVPPQGTTQEAQQVGVAWHRLTHHLFTLSP